MSRICVKGLSKATDEKSIKDYFSSKGEVTDVRVMRTADGKSRRFAFIGFRNENQANTALQYFNNTFLDSARISVETAKKLNEVDIKSARSKHTKKKLNNNDDDEVHRSNDDIKSKAKQSTNNIVNNKNMSQQQKEFLEIMKPRRLTKFWTNDESLPNEIAEEQKNSNSSKSRSMNPDSIKGTTKSNKSIQKTFNNDSDNETDDDSDINEADFSNDDENDDENDITENKRNSKQEMSNLDFLRSKITKKWSDDDDMDNENDEEDDHGSTKDEDVEMKGSDDNNDEGIGELIDNEEIEHSIDTGRLFIRNLPFSCTEEELTTLFSSYGPITETHLPLDGERKGKGFGFIQFMIPEHARTAIADVDGTPFQGRLLHIIPAKPQPEQEAITSKSNTYKQKKENERKLIAGKKDGWNTSFVRSDTVVENVAARFGVKTSDILDTSEQGGEMAVRLAVGEAHILMENKKFFEDNGIDMTALESNASSNKAIKRSSTTILIKNLPHDLVEEELENIFSKHGAIGSFSIANSKSVGLVEYLEPVEARAAFKAIAYRRYKHLPIYLEWAPLQTTKKVEQSKANSNKKISDKQIDEAKKKQDEFKDNDDEFGTLFIKNLNFSTTEEDLRSHIIKIGALGFRTVSISTKVKGNQTLSTGYGFVEFVSSELAKQSLSKINGSILDGHSLEAKPSDKRLSSSQSKSKSSSATDSSNAGSKLIVRNVAFQTTQSDLRSLFSTFGNVKRVRIPKKMGGDHRGFAFVDFSTSQEAAKAMSSLSSTHLYGRHLVIEYAREESTEDLTNLRKRANVDVKAIKSSQKKQKFVDDKDEIDGFDDDDYD